MSDIFNLGEDFLTVGKALQILNGHLKAQINPATKDRIKASFEAVQEIASRDEAVYGINTGFGPLCNTIISKDKTKELQRKILLSHSVGVGEPIAKDIAKLMLILKVHSLSFAHSGIAIEVLDRILWHFEEDIIPVVPEQGSVGASGDLAPLAHLFLPLIGEGKVMYKGAIHSAKSLLEKKGIEPLLLGPKAGLALINGTQFIAAHAVILVDKFHNCLSQADINAAMMIEGLLGSEMPFHESLHLLRPYPGNIHVASRIHMMLAGSQIMASHSNCDKVQDPYSLRCVPQVHGASRSAWLHLKDAVEIEINSVTDNPVVFSSDFTISGGNFHGQPLALPIDYACLAISELGNISDRRAYLSLEGKSAGVPKLLMENTGVNSGFMIFQYTGAALASENKGLCFPASADSIPTSLGQEDHVSMGSIGGRKALRVCENVEKILAIEMLCAAQAFDFHKPLHSGPILNGAHQLIREEVAFASEDRFFGEDIEKGIQLVKEKRITNFVNEKLALKNQEESQFENY